MGIELSSGRTNCWVCGKHTLVAALSEISKIEPRKIVALVKGIELKRLLPKQVQQVGGQLIIPKGVQEMGPAHRSYLRERGFNPAEIERLWGVKGITITAELKWRLFIPITLNGVTVSWTTRAIGKNVKMRYISARPDQERFHFKHSLYGIDLVRNVIIICEGPLDSWNVGPAATAMYGLGYTPEQVQLMAQFPKRVICLDNEEGAQRRARCLCDTLGMFPGKTLNICLDAEDPGSAPREEVKRLRRAVLGD